METDLDADGNLSFKEFKLWYAEEGLSAECFDEAAADVEQDSSEPEDADTGPVTFDLVEVRRLTNLGGHTVEMAFQVFAGAADKYGIISCATFN